MILLVVPMPTVVPWSLVSVPIPTVLLLPLSPSPRYYRHFCPHYRGFTAVPIPMQLSTNYLLDIAEQKASV